MVNRITPDDIFILEDNQVFVFGSNLEGRHGKGAAKRAVRFGAKYGQAHGLQGQSYAIPTKDLTINKGLLLSEIRSYVDNFIEFAYKNKDKQFLVVEIGCKLAGHSPMTIAPLFKNAINIDNISLPQSFWVILNLV